MIKRSKLLVAMALPALCLSISSCANLSPEAQESIEDFRASLPSVLRGDAVPLEEQPRPTLSGRWVDKDFEQLSISLSQSASKLNIRRDGDRQGVIVKQSLELTLTGRAIKGKFVNNDPNQIRPTIGSCVGSASKDSTRIQLTCTYGGETFPVNLARS